MFDATPEGTCCVDCWCMGEQTWKSCGHVGRRRISFVYVCEREIWFGALVIFNQMAACSKLLLMTAFYCPTPPNALHPYSGSNWYIHIDICRNGLVESCFVSPRHLGCLDVCPCFSAKDTVHKEDRHGVFCCFSQAWHRDTALTCPISRNKTLETIYSNWVDGVSMLIIHATSQTSEELSFISGGGGYRWSLWQSLWSSGGFPGLEWCRNVSCGHQWSNRS